MRRVPQKNYAVIDKFGPGKHGFGPGNKANGTVATIPGADLMNAWQEELAHVIEAVGGVLDDDDNHQLFASILKISAGSGLVLDSIESLRAITNANASKIFTLGYWQAQDGAGVYCELFLQSAS